MFTTNHLHPMLVHFPIALIAIGFLAELAFIFFKKEICLTKVGYYLLIVGTLAACVTWLSGSLLLPIWLVQPNMSKKLTHY